MSTQREPFDETIDPSIVTDPDTRKVTMYCIKTCSTCKTASTALRDAGVVVIDRDVRAKDMGLADFRYLEEQVGWEALVNTRSQTWRNLEPSRREGLDRDRALELLVEKPTLMKRPVIDMGTKVLVGWTDETRAALAL